jgi:hypothetical protein
LLLDRFQLFFGRSIRRSRLLVDLLLRWLLSLAGLSLGLLVPVDLLAGLLPLWSALGQPACMCLFGRVFLCDRLTGGLTGTKLFHGHAAAGSFTVSQSHFLLQDILRCNFTFTILPHDLFAALRHAFPEFAVSLVFVT